MTTKRQVKRITGTVFKDLGAFMAEGDHVFLGRQVHIMRGFQFWRTSQGDIFDFRPVFRPLCDPRASFNANMIYRPGPDLWRWSSPALAEDLKTVVLQSGLPALEATATLASYLEYVSDESRFDFPPHTHYNLQRACVFAALGDLDTSQRELDLLNKKIEVDIRALTRGEYARNKELREETTEYVEERQFVAHPLGALLAKRDLPGLARLLHTFEARMVDRYNIRRLWDPAPFPLETDNGLTMEPPPEPGTADDVIRSFAV